jgi:hypothetical protein
MRQAVALCRFIEVLVAHTVLSHTFLYNNLYKSGLALLQCAP